MPTNPRVFSWLAKAMTAANQVKVFQALLFAKHSSQFKTPLTSRIVTPMIAAAVLLTPTKIYVFSKSQGLYARYYIMMNTLRSICSRCQCWKFIARSDQHCCWELAQLSQSWSIKRSEPLTCNWNLWQNTRRQFSTLEQLHVYWFSKVWPSKPPRIHRVMVKLQAAAMMSSCWLIEPISFSRAFASDCAGLLSRIVGFCRAKLQCLSSKYETPRAYWRLRWHSQKCNLPAAMYKKVKLKLHYSIRVGRLSAQRCCFITKHANGRLQKRRLTSPVYVAKHIFVSVLPLPEASRAGGVWEGGISALAQKLPEPRGSKKSSAHPDLWLIVLWGDLGGLLSRTLCCSLHLSANTALRLQQMTSDLQHQKQACGTSSGKMNYWNWMIPFYDCLQLNYRHRWLSFCRHKMPLYLQLF